MKISNKINGRKNAWADRRARASQRKTKIEETIFNELEIVRDLCEGFSFILEAFL